MKLSVIPQPLCFKMLSDEPVIKITRLCEIETEKGCEKAKNELIRFLTDSFEAEISGTGKEKIILSIKENCTEKEGYHLCVNKNTVMLTASSDEGLFYAVQSLKQLLIQGDFSLPEILIEDAPRFPSRGFMLDCGRYFFTKEAVMHFIDMMAIHKLNEFHWHLSEDQGFRCQLEDNILLTEIGSYRSHTNFNTTPHSGYYTKTDMKEIVAYAHERCIKVIPEIDTPGHAVSMIAAYPFLSCFERELTVATHWGVKHDVLCVGKESTFRFMESVFDELTEIFTDGIIHLGGDEVPTTRWKICPHCQQRMKEENLKDESELHTYYLQRIADYIQAKGYEVRMWNDRKKEKMISSSVAWQLWDDEISPAEAAEEINKGRKFVNSALNAYYLDLPYGLVSLKDTYNYNPVFENISPEKEKNILGIEACLWTEFVPHMKKADFCTYPRLGAMSETAWTKQENRNYEQFCEKLDGYYKVLRFYGIAPVKKKFYNPNPVRKLASVIYWERRKLCWEGLHNLIDNYIVKKKYSK
ncbi:MAG: beta-N-acetylhexosaminidase [Acutalibacteraceae bacterium]|nr:beta-N-acetylhexosaminidase [Acutalibacteraceae bacterium]